MKLMRSSNPALNDNVFRNLAQTAAGPMTIQGTVSKTAILLLLVIATASISWNSVATGGTATGWAVIGGIGGFIAALVTIFKKHLAPITAPAYALFEGLFLGGMSAVFEVQYPGIVFQAVGLTFATMFCLLGIYRSGLIQVTENFRLGIFAATGGIALFYFVSFILSLFGVPMSIISGNGLMAIGFSLFVVAIAALNLVMDFDFIENGAAAGAPKYMEWYGAFGLMVTLIWLYIEILRLLAKLRSRD